MELEELLDNYQSLIRGALLANCPDWLAGDMDDLIQEVHLRLWKRLEAEKTASFNASYVKKVVMTTLIDAIRRARTRARDRSVEFIADDSSQSPIEVESGPTDPAARSVEVHAALTDCLGRLDGESSSAVRLKLQGFNHNEVARLKGWTPARSRNLIYRGLAKIRECLLSKGISGSM